MTIQIRPAAGTDAEEIAKVRVVTWRNTYRGMLPDRVLDELDIEKETLRYQEGIASLPPDQAFFVAEVDFPQKQVAGYCICGPDRDPNSQSCGEVYALYVLPDFQGQGIGRSLIHAAGLWLADQGFRRMIIFVLRDNIPSRKFYEAVGGRAEREKQIDIRDFQAQEIGYGYDLSGLNL